MLLFLSLVGFNTPSGSGQSSSNISSGNPYPGNPVNTALGDDDDDWSYAPPSNYKTPDAPPPPRPGNPDPKFERDDNDPLTDSPGIKGSNKKKKRRKGKRDLRRGGFLSSLKIDRGSALGGTSKKNPYSIGGM